MEEYNIYLSEKHHSYTLYPTSKSNKILEEDAVTVKTFKANTWKNAVTIYDTYMDNQGE